MEDKNSVCLASYLKGHKYSLRFKVDSETFACPWSSSNDWLGKQLDIQMTNPHQIGVEKKMLEMSVTEF